MAQKTHFSIREYRPSDRYVVTSLFREGARENVYPSFFKALGHSDHIGIALSLAVAGYILGGSSYFQALLFGSAWAGLIYYCCSEIHENYTAQRMSSDMTNIPASYLDNPDNNIWVAEVCAKDRVKVIGVASLIGRPRDGSSEAYEGQNGGVKGDAVREGSYGELSQVIVAFPFRRQSIGSHLTQKAMDFCKERGFARITVDVSLPQAAAVSMFRKLGFVQTSSHMDTHHFRWFSKLARIDVVRMEKFV
ncbi:N-acetyltransferase family 8 member 3 [Synchiropus splendidus]|uniref:N-acetyltransferase family 8 member 3 n=1 Tax=Synchiropus splendidus TaxID=270530 RepID=UPI00237DA594|nr:N-acetyltransferase family 8 member 3 [Synchiropus splendidus]